MYNIKHLIIFLFFIFIFLIVNSTTIVEDFDVVKKAKKLGKGVGNDILKGLKLDKKKKAKAKSEAQKKEEAKKAVKAEAMAELKNELATTGAIGTTGELLTTSGVNDKNANSVANQMTGKKKDGSIKKIVDKVDDKIKKNVNKTLPSLVSKSIAKPVAEIKNKQSRIDNKLNRVNLQQQKINKKIGSASTDLEKQSQEHNNKLTELYNKLLSDLSSQYNMYKTGLQNEISVATESVKTLNANVSDASEKVYSAKDEAKGYADMTNKIYNDVFGKTTAMVVQQDNAEFSGKQGFTVMDDSAYTANNKNLFDLEKDVVIAINNFNTIYYEFIRCKTINCTGTVKTEGDVSTAADTLNAKIKLLQDAYNDANIQTNDATFQANHTEIMNKAKSIDELRRNLDSKMETLVKNRNPPTETTQQYDATIYAGIAWSVLATSLLFYVFIE
jgi:hypothetical protein